jgi:hypothetical protein
VRAPYNTGFLEFGKIFRHGADGFTSPPKEDRLLIFISLKNPSSSAGVEPANLELSGKQDNHQTIEFDKNRVLTRIFGLKKNYVVGE